MVVTVGIDYDDHAIIIPLSPFQSSYDHVVKTHDIDVRQEKD